MCGTRRRSRPQPRQSPCHVDAAHVGMDAGVGGEGGCGSGAGGTASESSGAGSRRPIACIVLGMAGSGKTTLMHRLNTHLHEAGTPYYLVNLDPAVADTPFGANIDIRDTVNYREVMKQYQLGPNGGILTSLNLFATRFDEVLKLVAARAQESRYVLFDTPGQIEIFTWSASGAIITEALASAMPTVVVYVVDTPRSAHAVTFMSNMLYACSILYKTKLSLLLAFNKIDVSPHGPLLEWMTDLEAFQAALQSERSYMGTLATSMALMLEEFYKSLDVVGVSAMTGEGMAGFFAAVSRAAAIPRAHLPHHARPHAPRYVCSSTARPSSTTRRTEPSSSRGVRRPPRRRRRVSVAQLMRLRPTAAPSNPSSRWPRMVPAEARAAWAAASGGCGSVRESGSGMRRVGARSTRREAHRTPPRTRSGLPRCPTLRASARS